MKWPGWTGVGERTYRQPNGTVVQPSKTAWDVLQLLIIPLILVGIALVFNAAQASREQKHQDAQIREDRALAAASREDATLDAYFARMSSLILNRGLTKSKPHSALRQVARTETLATLRRLDGSRKGALVQFLNEAGLLRIKSANAISSSSTGTYSASGPLASPIIDLSDADLRNADLRHATFEAPNRSERIQLIGDLRGARFDDAYLQGVTFFGGKGSYAAFGADLRGASFDRAGVSEVAFPEQLQGAKFRGAILTGDNFNLTNLTNARFDKATFQPSNTAPNSFKAACLNGASFAGADFNNYGAANFLAAQGDDVDFSGAEGLSPQSVLLGIGITNPRFDGAQGRPRITRQYRWNGYRASCR